MAFPQGCDFRQTSGFVTDPTNCNVAFGYGGHSRYPQTTAQGNNIGYDGGNASQGNDADRSNSVDARIAGLSYPSDGTPFRINLPASGNYDVYVALGQQGGSGTEGPFTLTIYDSTSSIWSGTINQFPIPGFADPSNNQYTAAQWASSNGGLGGGAVISALTFSTTTAKFTWGGNPLAHIFMQTSGGGAVFLPYDPWPLWMPVLAQ